MEGRSLGAQLIERLMSALVAIWQSRPRGAAREGRLPVTPPRHADAGGAVELAPTRR